jgi:beta-lactamase regulating signal transducer with metallopeptidase domain
MWMWALFLKILNMSLTAGIVITLVLVTRLPLKKAPKIFSYALWAVVLFRLVCPVSFSSPFSLFSLLPALASTPNSSIYAGISYIPSDIVSRPSPQVDFAAPEGGDTITAPQGEAQTTGNPAEGWMTAAAFLWLSGVAAMLIYSASSIFQLRRKLIGAIKLRDNIYLADHIASPFVIGLFRPKIYLPSTLQEKEQSYVILHEQTHIRRLDHIFKILAFLALAVHWFNPFVWIAFIFFVKDMEMSCDERVLKQMGGDIKGAYGASLLSLATGRRLINGSPLAFGEGNLKGRIKNIMNFKKPAFWIIATAAAVVIVAGAVLLTNPAPKATPAASAENTGPFVGYERDAAADTFDVYTDEGGRYIMSLPLSLFEKFPASDRTDPNWQPGWMNIDIYCGSINGFTWAVVCTGPSLGTGNANVCTSMDGGKTWWVGDKNAMYTGTVTGAGFASSKVGFMSYRYFVDQGPEISRTLDGGKTWERMTVDIPEELKEYKMTPLIPTFTGASGTYPIELFDSDGNTSIVSLTTADGGMTWQWTSENVMVAYVDEALSETQARTLQSMIEQLPNVKYATFVTREEAMKQFEAKYADKSLFENIEPSIFRSRYCIYMRDTSLAEQTAKDIALITGITKVNTGGY